MKITDAWGSREARAHSSDATRASVWTSPAKNARGPAKTNAAPTAESARSGAGIATAPAPWAAAARWRISPIATFMRGMQATVVATRATPIAPRAQTALQANEAVSAAGSDPKVA